MKANLLIMAFIFGLTQSVLAAEKIIQVSVNGMVCGFCAQGITKKFKAEESVAKVDVKLTEKTVSLEVKDGQDISDEKIKEILTDSGYTVENIVRK